MGHKIFWDIMYILCLFVSIPAILAGSVLFSAGYLLNNIIGVAGFVLTVTSSYITVDIIKQIGR